MKNVLFFAVIVCVILAGLFVYFDQNKSEPIIELLKQPIPTITPHVAQVINTPTRSATSSPTIKPTVIPTYVPTNKKSYTIALFGDSMIDTMGERTEYLEHSLTERYGPSVTFHLYNYGIGAQNIGMGLSRFNSSFSNRERSYPPITDIQADIIILGTFSYNPYSPHDPGRHRNEFNQLVTLAKQTSSRIYVLIEIAPLGAGFGKGKNGVNWPEDQAIAHARNIVEQLQNAKNVAQAQNIPIINAYDATRTQDVFGSSYYVNPDDGIHPSIAGHTFVADLISKTIILP